MRLSFQFPFTQSQTVGVLSCPIASLAVRFTEAAVEEPNVGRKALVPPEPHSHSAATFESVCRGIETLGVFCRISEDTHGRRAIVTAVPWLYVGLLCRVPFKPT